MKDLPRNPAYRASKLLDTLVKAAQPFYWADERLDTVLKQSRYLLRALKRELLQSEYESLVQEAYDEFKEAVRK